MNGDQSRELILEYLDEISRENRVEILYAIESGSRAWGFESPDSDWDVRFLFVHPADSYLSIDAPLEQLELKADTAIGALDAVGWDLRKALRLLRKSNPSLIEWLHSPIVYVAAQPETDRLRDFAQRAFSPVRSAYHYASMSRSNDAAVVRGEPVVLKKYFYMLRTTLAHQWGLKHRTMPPVRFEELLESIVPQDAPMRSEVMELLARKRVSPELGVGSRLPHLHEFLVNAASEMESSLRALSAEGECPLDDRLMSELDEFFRSTVKAERSSKVV
jgi:predicted nucleotidyltransferase